MKHLAERPESYKKDVEVGYNKGKSMSIPQVKSVIRHVDKENRNYTSSSKSKAIHAKMGEKKEGLRYTPASMPKHNASYAERVEHYKTHKGKMVSDKVNPKTGKYHNTY